MILSSYKLGRNILVNGLAISSKKLQVEAQQPIMLAAEEAFKVDTTFNQQFQPFQNSREEPIKTFRTFDDYGREEEKVYHKHSINIECISFGSTKSKDFLLDDKFKDVTIYIKND